MWQRDYLCNFSFLLHNKPLCLLESCFGRLEKYTGHCMKKNDDDKKLRAEFVVPFIKQRNSSLQSGSNPMKLLINSIIIL